MNNRFLTLLAAAALCFAALPARADVCDDVTHAADGWHKVANYIDEHSENGKLRPSEVQKVAHDARELIPYTKELGSALVREGKQDQRTGALGKQILAALEELGGLKDADWSEAVVIIDRLVEILDKVDEQCRK